MNNMVLKKCYRLLLGAIFILAYLLCVTIATWDRPEAMVPFVAMLSLAGLLTVVALLFGKKISLSWLDGLVLLVLVYFFIRAWMSPVQLYGQTDMILVGSAALVWFGLSMLVELKAFGCKVWIVLMLVLLGINLASSYYQINVDVRWAWLVERSDRVTVPTGIFTHYNYFGNFAALAALSCLGGVLDRSSGRWMRLGAGLVVVGNVALLALSSSRGAFVSLTVGLVVFSVLYGIYLWTSGAFKKPVVALATTAIVIMVLALVVSQFGRLGVERGWTAQGGQVQDGGRKDYSSLAVDQFFEAPLWGGGAHSVEWRSASLLTQRGEGALGTLNYAHNEYFQILCDYGLVGFLCVVVLLIAYGGQLLYSLLEREDLVWGMAVFAAFAAFCVHCLFSFPAHIPANLLTLVVVAALGRKSASRDFTGWRKLWLSAPLASVLLVTSTYGLHFAWKELAAFKVYRAFNETMQLSEWQPELREQTLALESAAERAPNFRRHQRLGEMYWALYVLSGDSIDREASDRHYLKAAELYPMSAALRLNEARIFALSGNYEEAEASFTFVIKHGVSQRKWLSPYWSYGLYCYRRGNTLWFERKSAEALAYFLKAESLLSHAIPPKEGRAELKEIKKALRIRVELLRSAGVK